MSSRDRLSRDDLTGRLTVIADHLDAMHRFVDPPLADHFQSMINAVRDLAEDTATVPMRGVSMRELRSLVDQMNLDEALRLRAFRQMMMEIEAEQWEQLGGFEFVDSE